MDELADRGGQPNKKKVKLEPTASPDPPNQEIRIRVTTYYLENFQLMIKDVKRRYSGIFTPEEFSLLRGWISLSLPAQKLYIRLFSRKPTWFRTSNTETRYPEIENLMQLAIPQLKHNNLLIESSIVLENPLPNQSTQDLLSHLLASVLKKKELLSIIHQCNIPLHQTTPKLQKRKRQANPNTKYQLAELIAREYIRPNTPAAEKKPRKSFSPSTTRQSTLASYFASPTNQTYSSSPCASHIPIKEEIQLLDIDKECIEEIPEISPIFLLPDLVERKIGEECIALTKTSKAFFNFVQHLFFLNPWQDQSLFVLSHMERIRYPNEVKEFARKNVKGMFTSRKEFEGYQDALFMEMELNYAIQKLHPTTVPGYTDATGPWKMSLEEVSSSDLFNDSFLMRYHYDWQCHKELSPQHTLIRIIHNCALHLFIHSYHPDFDPYRSISPLPTSLATQIQAIISIQNNQLDQLSKTLPKRADSEPSLHIQTPLDSQETYQKRSPTQSKTYPEKTNYNPQSVTIKKEGGSEEAQRVTIKKEGGEQAQSKINGTGEGELKENQKEMCNEDGAGVLHPWMDRYRAEWVMARMITHGTAELEKQKEYRAASCFYRLLIGCSKWSVARRGQWWERLSLLLTSHLKNPSFALSVALLGLKDPQLPALAPERISLTKRIERLYKPPIRWSSIPKFPIIREAPKKYLKGTLLSSSVGKKNKWMPLTGTEEQFTQESVSYQMSVNVEELSLQWYQTKGWEGMHCEGGFIYPLFSILCFSALFADIPFVFQSQFQDSPLDLLSIDFYENRKHLFEIEIERIRNSSNDELSQRLETFWLEREGELIHALDWKRFPLYLLQKICICFGGSKLADLFDIVAKNYKASRSGMPDLLLWKVDEQNEEKCGEVLFSEVKGPRDRLSSKQILWLHRMLEVGIPVEVLHVSSQKNEIVINIEGGATQ